MKWLLRSSLAGCLACFAFTDESMAQLFRDRAQPASGRGIPGGGSRPLLRQQPQASRATVVPSRPQLPTSRPQLPQTPIVRPQIPSSSSQSNLQANRPALGNLNRPNINVPNVNIPNVRIPNANIPSINRPSTNSPLVTGPSINRPSLNLPSINRPSLAKPSTLPSLPSTRPSLAKPSTLPSQPSTRPSLAGPSTLPSRPNPSVNLPSLVGGSPSNKLPAKPLPTKPLPSRPDGGINLPQPLPELISGSAIARPTPLPGINRPGQGRPSIGGAVPAIAGKPSGPTWGQNWWNNGNNGWSNNNTIVSLNFNRPSWDRPNWSHVGLPNQTWHHSWHHHCIHPHYHVWYNGCWSNYWDSTWYSPIIWGGSGWGLGSWTTSTTRIVYTNPYYVNWISAQPAVVSYDYSQPIVINNYSDSLSPTASYEVSPTESEPTNPALKHFDAGLASFQAGDYASAVESLELAIRQNGSDPVAHEVCALALFAQGEYQKSALILNALLASAPGMDWTSMSALYGNPDDYTQQLRALEAACRANPNDPSTAFVLAYHYLVLGEKEAAINALKIVIANEPNDTTAKRMLEGLSSTGVNESPSAGEGDDTTNGVLPTTDLVGEWTAKAGNSTIDLVITDASQFTWTATEPGKAEILLEGELTSSAGEIVLETKTQGSLAGIVRPKSNDEWTFVPPGAKPEEGLTFQRRRTY
jgi:hypothetical protein